MNISGKKEVLPGIFHMLSDGPLRFKNAAPRAEDIPIVFVADS